MLSTVSLVVAGLSTGNKIGLIAVAAVFILFALASSFVLPVLNPNFPGRGLGWYVAVCVLFFVAMMAAVLVFGKEKSEATGSEQPAAATTTQTQNQTQTQQGSTSSAPPPAAPAQGDASAGKAVFASAGCGSCHTLKAAGSTGTIGPNLDDLKPPLDTVVHQVEVGGGPMPAFKGQLSDKQIQDVAAYVVASTHS
jgi:mono/diheme cytochrome c family protein